MTNSDPLDSLNPCFGRVLAQLRNERGWTQEEFGFECNLSRQFVSQLERGISSPSLATIVRVAAGLRMSEDRLVKVIFDRLRSGQSCLGQ